MNIFYIEKEKLLITYFSSWAQKNGHEFFSTEEIDCYHLIDDLCPEILLLACQMDHESLQVLIEKVRSGRNTSDIIILGFGFQHEYEALENFLDGVLRKPLVPSELNQKLLTLIANKKGTGHT